MARGRGRTINIPINFIEKAREDSSLGFETFYTLVHGRDLPVHAREWIDGVYAARKKGKGVVIEAFRGSTKTTTLTVTFAVFRIGQEPHTSNLLIQVGEDSAHDNSSLIADIIENNPAWKAIFPHVVPDKSKGWGANGYEVMRSDIGYAEWRRMNSARHEPTFLGLGRTSRSIIGKHPTGVLIIDDIDDENTTRSDRELSKTLSLLKGTIFPTMVPDKTWTIFVGTPWVNNDTIGYAKSTGEFLKFKTPVFDGEDKPVWPEKFDEKEIEKQRRLAGELEFARMFLLDLTAAEGVNLKREWLHDYPYIEIGDSWPVVMGVDYASTADKLKDKDRDYFALAVGRLIPGGGVVLVDGIRGRVSQGEAEALVRSWAANYPTTALIVIEKLGKGEEFYYQLLSNTRMPIFPATAGNKSKGERFQKQMAPLFQFSRAWISNAASSFLNRFRKEWVQWPLCDHDDVLDATYYMILGATQMGNLALPAEPKGGGPSNWLHPKKKKENPYRYLGNV